MEVEREGQGMERKGVRRRQVVGVKLRLGVRASFQDPAHMFTRFLDCTWRLLGNERQREEEERRAVEGVRRRMEEEEEMEEKGRAKGDMVGCCS